jgi:hypothetical protein
MRKIPSIVFGWIIGLIVFLILLFILNRIFIDIQIYNLVMAFINANVIFLIILSFLFMLSEIFRRLPFPFVLPGPLLNAVASVMVTAFILRVLIFIEGLLGINAVSKLSFAFPLIYMAVFIFVVAIGYIRIFTRKDKKSKHSRKRRIDD